MKNMLFRVAMRAGLMVVLSSLAACVAIRPSEPMSDGKRAVSVTLIDSLPEAQPANAKPFPGGHYVLLPGESLGQFALGQAMPVPFVMEAVVSVMEDQVAKDRDAQYRDINPYQIVQQTMQGSFLLNRPADAYTVEVRPFVFVQDCYDDQYRLALVAHASHGDWVGRFMVHLPTTYAVDAYKNPSPELRATLSRELAEASVRLRLLMERGARGELRSKGVTAEVGSLHLAGARSGGLLTPTLTLAKGADVIDEDSQYVVVRIPGDMKLDSATGGLFFGVHELRRDQLHTFRKVPPAAP